MMPYSLGAAIFFFVSFFFTTSLSLFLQYVSSFLPPYLTRYTIFYWPLSRFSNCFSANSCIIEEDKALWKYISRWYANNRILTQFFLLILLNRHSSQRSSCNCFYRYAPIVIPFIISSYPLCFLLSA